MYVFIRNHCTLFNLFDVVNFYNYLINRINDGVHLCVAIVNVVWFPLL